MSSAVFNGMRRVWRSARRLWCREYAVAWGGCMATILAFDVLWSFATSFRGLGFVQTYVFGAALALVMSSVRLLPRGRVWLAAVLVAADALCVANLIYCRTYCGPIPPASYLLAGNAAEFGDAVRGLLRPADMVFVLITVAAVWLTGARRLRGLGRSYGIWLVAAVTLCGACSIGAGGPVGHIERLKSMCYYHATPPVVYTLPVSIAVDMLESNRVVSEAEMADARSWLEEHGRMHRVPQPVRRYVPDNVVMIIVESLEAWPLGRTIEGREITPELNRLMADTATTWVARRVLSQVGPGRSIDGQLLMTAGMLPMQDYVYSMRFAGHDYPHLSRELREQGGMRSYLLSGDRSTTWNQGAIVKSFGIDEVRFRDRWDDSESFGHPRNPSDGSFLRQVEECMRSGDIWPEGEKAFVEVVTYSSHFPFRIPAEQRHISLEGEYAEPLADYVTAINYTDHAVGAFVDYLMSRSDADRTMIVIVGDHEGLAASRDEVRRSSEVAAALVDAEAMVPMIVLNAPVPGRYDYVMGQVDVYPTVLDMAGADRGRPGCFGGMGTSALSPDAPGMAVDITGRMSGSGRGMERDSVAAAMLGRSYRVSSTLIRADMMRR